MTQADFSEAFAAVKQAAETQRGERFSRDLGRALVQFNKLPDYDPAVLATALADVLPELASPTGAGCIAVWLGTGVEDGNDAELTCRQIVETFLKWSRTVETLPEEDEAEPDGETFAEMPGGNAGSPIVETAVVRRGGVQTFDEDDEAGEATDPKPEPETIAGLQYLGQALVAHLARSPKMRGWVAGTEKIYREFERVEHLSFGAAWVVALLKQQSGTLVVLNAARKKGVVVEYRNIANCFHLFTLLQGALAGVMPDAGAPSEDILAIVRGKRHDGGQDRAWWHYGQPYAPAADIGASIWGEMAPHGISSVDASQVLLLWPPILASRTWDAGFFTPVLQASMPSVEVMRELPRAEVDAWWARLKIPEPPAAAGRS